MNRTVALGIVALTLALSPGSAFAQQAGPSKEQLVGSWTLVTADAFGPNPKGLLIFEPSGHFSAILASASRPKFSGNDRRNGTAEEYKAAMGGALAYFGTYSVSGTDLDMRIEGSSYPNWDQTSQKRTNVSISGDELKYTQPTPSAGGPPTVIVWRRAK